MKIALVHEMLHKFGGAERVVRKFADFYPESPIYTNFYDKELTDKWFSGKKIHPSYLQRYYEWFKNPKFFVGKMAGAFNQFDFSSYDLVISSSSAFAHTIKTGSKTKHISYVHSPMRALWDNTHKFQREQSAIMKLPVASLLSDLRILDYYAADRADLLIANSKHVQKRIAKFWRQESKVIYPPVQVNKYKPRQGHEDYFLMLTALTPFKRIDIAIRAFNKLRRRLIIIGDGAQRKVLESIANSNIEFLGFKEDAMAREYMENCRAFIFCNEEDFGIAPVEAMAAGKAVIAYGVGGVTESVQPGISGEFFYEQTPEALIDAVTKFMLNEKNYDSKKIRKIADQFDESVFEREFKRTVKEVMMK